MAMKLAVVAVGLALVITLLSLSAWRSRVLPRGSAGQERRAPERPHAGHSIAKRLLATVAVLALFVSLISISVLALFTSTASVPSNTFSTGTVVIGTSPTSALVTFSAMAPGDEVVNPITVSNTGTLALRYAVTSTTTEDTLAAALDLTIKSGVTTCTTGGFGTDGTVLYGPADLGSMAGINVIGDPTSGDQGSDRTLTASGSEVLCFKVALPIAATGPEGATTTATFAFQAEQTKNNP